MDATLLVICFFLPYSAVQEKAYVDLVTGSMDNVAACFYGTTLPKDPSHTIGCSWTSADPSTFLIRGESYFQDHQKAPLSTYTLSIFSHVHARTINEFVWHRNI